MGENRENVSTFPYLVIGASYLVLIFMSKRFTTSSTTQSMIWGTGAVICSYAGMTAMHALYATPWISWVGGVVGLVTPTGVSLMYNQVNHKFWKKPATEKKNETAEIGSVLPKGVYENDPDGFRYTLDLSRYPINIRLEFVAGHGDDNSIMISAHNSIRASTSDATENKTVELESAVRIAVRIPFGVDVSTLYCEKNSFGTHEIRGKQKDQAGAKQEELADDQNIPSSSTQKTPLLPTKGWQQVPINGLPN